MAGLALLYNNYADLGLYSGGSWLSTLPLNNVITQDVQQVARSSDAQNSSTTFRIDLGLARNIDGVAFGPVNLSPGATWQVDFYSDNAYTVLVHSTGLQTAFGDVINWANTSAWFEWEDPRFWYGVTSDIDELPFYAYHLCPATVLAQYCKFSIFDAANADGHLDIGRVLIGQVFKPVVNYDENNELSVEPLVDMVETLGGRRSYWERGTRRKASYSFAELSQDELFGSMFHASLRSGISRHVFVVPNSDDTSYGTRRSFLATFNKAAPLKQLLVQRGSTVIDFDEVL